MTLAEDFREQAEQLATTPAYQPPPDVRALIGGLDRADRRALAEQIASEEGIKVTSAQRRLQRYSTSAREQRRPNEAALQRLQQRVQARRSERRRDELARRVRRGLRVDIDASVDVHSGRERPRMRRMRNVRLRGEDVDPIAAAIAAGDWDAATAELEGAVLHVYGEGQLDYATIDEYGEFGIRALDEPDPDEEAGEDWPELEDLPW